MIGYWVVLVVLGPWAAAGIWMTLTPDPEETTTHD